MKGDYSYPDPYSFGTTARMERGLKKDKQEFKAQELEKELKDEKLMEE